MNASTSAGVGGRPVRSRRDAADQRGCVGFLGGAVTFPLQSLRDIKESIAFRGHVAILHRWKGMPSRRNKGPVVLPFGALLNPLLNDVDFAGRQRVPGVSGGMRLPVSLAVIRRISSLFGHRRNDGKTPAQILFGFGFDVEAQLGQPPRLVRPMARITFVGKNRPDVAVEFDRS